MRLSWPLVGREDELEFVLDRVAGPIGRAVVVTGQAGVGKTRLAHEALARAETRGLAAAWCAASTSSSSIPLGTFAGLLPLDEGMPRPEEGLAGAAALLHRAATLVSRLADGKPFLIVCDDAHHLDDLSATLVHRLALDKTVSLLLTVRTGEPAPDAVRLLSKDRIADPVEVQPLSRSEVDALTSVALGGAVDGAAVRQVWESSQGNPLYLRELVEAAVASGTLRCEFGTWRLKGSLRASSTLNDLLRLRLERVEPADRAALEFLAVIDEAGLSSLQAMFGDASLERLEARELITIRTDGRRRPVRLGHPLLGEVLGADLPQTRALSLRRRAAELVEGTGARRRGDTMRVALLRLDADGTAEPSLLEGAARSALFGGNTRLAERLARAALDAGGGLGAQRLLGEILRWLGRRDESAELLAAIDVTALSSDEEITALAMATADNLFRGFGRHEEAARVLRDAESRVAGESWRDEMRAMRAVFDTYAGRVRAALENAEELAGRPPSRATAEACMAAALAMWVAGRSDDAVDVARRGFEASKQLGRQVMLARSSVHVARQSVALAEAGRLAEADAIGRPEYEAAVSAGLLLGQAEFALVLGWIKLGEGRLRDAEGLFREGALAFRDLADRGFERWGWMGAAQAAALRGNTAAATEHLGRVDAIPGGPVRLMDVQVERTRAWTAAASGERERAREILLAAAAGAEEAGQHAFEAAALHDVVRLGDAPAAVERLVEVGSFVQGPLMGRRVAHATALLAEDAAQLDSCSARFEELGALLYAAEAAAQAARHYRQDGEPRRAAASSLRAHELAARCQGARTPALAEADEPVPLTLRERDVATLAARGLSSRDIGERLHLSVRTVDNYLQRSYAKLGVRGRDELADRLGAGRESE
ncbi:MAG: AAA family ATPase [Actinomycetota bacterium]